jgi:hypothetical protein
MQDMLTEAILSHPRLKLDRKIALVKALGKVIWIQNDLFAKWYVRDGEEFEEEIPVPEVEREGYLNGKRILDDGSEGESDIEAPGLSGCPFKNMMANKNNGVSGVVADTMGRLNIGEESPTKYGHGEPGVQGCGIETASPHPSATPSPTSIAASPKPPIHSAIPRPVASP